MKKPKKAAKIFSLRTIPKKENFFVYDKSIFYLRQQSES